MRMTTKVGTNEKFGKTLVSMVMFLNDDALAHKSLGVLQKIRKITCLAKSVRLG